MSKSKNRMNIFDKKESKRNNHWEKNQAKRSKKEPEILVIVTEDTETHLKRKEEPCE